MPKEKGIYFWTKRKKPDYIGIALNKNGLYGSGRYGYTLNDQSVDVVVANTTIATASMADINYNANFTASVDANEVIKVTVA